MRTILPLVILAALGASPALAQTTTTATRHHTAGAGYGAPIDHGPFTPQANAAYQGGGMILQGAPGAPAPMPQPTPPGQTPANMVPQ